MLITDDFVFIHQPKTGGTFVREAIDEICSRELATPGFGALRRRGILRQKYKYRETQDYHDTCHDIPEKDRAKPILSIVRNPFDYYVSFYHFGWWASHPEDSYPDIGLVQKLYPKFPDLSFDEFLRLANTCFNEFSMIGGSREDGGLGYYTVQFLLFFFKDPQLAYQRINADYLADKKWLDDMYNVEFMRTHSLNQNLHDYLRRMKYPASYTDFLLEKSAVRPPEQLTDRPTRDYRSYYSEDSYNFVLNKERVLFSMFEDLHQLSS
jgi:hypothetical protein